MSCTWTRKPPIRLGSTYDPEARFLGKAIVSSFEATEYVPGERIRIVRTSGTMDIDVARTVERLSADRCVVSATVRGDAPGLMRLLGPLLPLLVRSSVSGDYRRSRGLLEDD